MCFRSAQSRQSLVSSDVTCKFSCHWEVKSPDLKLSLFCGIIHFSSPSFIHSPASHSLSSAARTKASYFADLTVGACSGYNILSCTNSKQHYIQGTESLLIGRLPVFCGSQHFCNFCKESLGGSNDFKRSTNTNTYSYTLFYKVMYKHFS